MQFSWSFEGHMYIGRDFRGKEVKSLLVVGFVCGSVGMWEYQASIGLFSYEVLSIEILAVIGVRLASSVESTISHQLWFLVAI